MREWEHDTERDLAEGLKKLAELCDVQAKQLHKVTVMLAKEIVDIKLRLERLENQKKQ